MEIKKILFPTDFSRHSENAREYSLHLAEKLKSAVYLLHAIEPLEYTEEVDEELNNFYDELTAQLNEKMKKEKIHFDSLGVETHTDLIIGPRLEVINNYASEKKVDLVIIGSHGIRTAEGDLSIGTISHKIMFTSPCPVLVVKNDNWKASL